MRIKFKTSISGDGFTVQAGDTVEWPNKEAKRFIERDMAEAADDAPESPKQPRKPKAPAKSADGTVEPQ